MEKQTAKNNTDIGTVMENGLAKTIIPSPRNYFSAKQLSLRSSQNTTEPDVFKLKTNNKYPYKMKNGPWGTTQFKVMDIIGTVLYYRLKERSDFDDIRKKFIPETDNYMETIDSWQKTIAPTMKLIPFPAEEENGSVLDEYNKMDLFPRGVKITEKDFKNLFIGSCPSFKHIIYLFNSTAQPEFQVNMPMKVCMKSGKTREIKYYINKYSRLFNFTYETVPKNKEDGRTIFVCFNTILGLMFCNNILARNFSIIDPKFYELPDMAQLLYRKFVSFHDYHITPKYLTEIKRRLSLNNGNNSTLIKTINNSLKSLKENNFIKSYKLDPKHKGFLEPVCYINRKEE